MTYCMADIHGRLDVYQQMLKLIQFTEDDHLYILGDIIDRGGCGIDLLLDTISRPNVTLLMGNHERMMLDTVGPTTHYATRYMWEQNGGYVTHFDFQYMRSRFVQKQLIAYLQSLPDCLDISVNNRKFHLVHACPSIDAEERLWGRNPISLRGATVVVGHTPTDQFRIQNKDSVYHIDCGCGHDHPDSRLACLRLDDLQEFYVKGA